MLLCSSPFRQPVETVPHPVYPGGIGLIDDRISNVGTVLSSESMNIDGMTS